MAIPTDHQVLSIPKAAAYLDVSRSTIYRRIHDGTLPVYRVGKQAIRIKLSDLETAFRSQD